MRPERGRLAGFAGLSGSCTRRLARAASSSTWFGPARSAECCYDDGYDELLAGLAGADLRTATLVVQALRSPEDLSRLRRLAVTHGFVNDRIRAVVWPRLLGITPPPGGGLTLALAMSPALAPSTPVAAAGSAAGALAVGPGAGAEHVPNMAVAGAGAGAHVQHPDGEVAAAKSGAAGSQGEAVEGGTSAGAAGELAEAEAGGWQSAAAQPPVSPSADCSSPSPPVEPPAPSPTAGDQDGCGLPPTGSSCYSASGEGAAEATTGLADTARRRDPSPAASGAEHERAASNGRASHEPGACSGPEPGAAAQAKREETESGAVADPGPRPAPGTDAGSEPHAETEAGQQPQSQSPPGSQLGSVTTSAPAAAAAAAAGEPAWDWDWERYLQWSQAPHRDSGVVEVDVARSLWSFAADADREARRAQLKRLLNAVVGAHAGDVFYYQGLHDVAGVLLLSMSVPAPAPHQHHPHHAAGDAAVHEPGVATAPASLATTPAGRRRRAKSEPQLSPSAASPHGNEDDSAATAAAAAAAAGDSPCSSSSVGHAAHRPDARAPSTANAAAAAAGELLAFAMLQRLATTHLRDATRPTLEPVVQLLGLVPPLVAAADPALGRHLGALGLQPFFALSWFLTWWAHELDALAPAARLFDFLLASHPLMPLYVGAVAMRSQRAALLGCEEMPELHSALANLQLVPAGGGSGGSGGGGGGGGRRGHRFGSGGGGGGGAKGPALPPLEELLRQAEALWRAKPPHVLLASLVPPSRGPGAPGAPAAKGGGSGLRQRRGAADKAGRGRGAGGVGEGEPGSGLLLSACVAHAARMEGVPAVWNVPPEPPLEWPGPELLGDAGGRSGLARLLGRAGTALAGRSRSALLSTALLAGVYVAAAVAIGYATFTRTAAGGGMQ
ncbi:hypothetical protein HXX76_002501 [Chlamydomonas incerta]|uniref:Rab-GAP TBC domain-containing protein n=1 Tax=Chlamydomonas incerta TaxID=51695 RepID=A0A835TQS7_CHLIN|nr:hypothetical protein HXX76_002501 [Chlamydomonas incerta]|eukprot:KAG2442415.1 hypothetical protein HXX76_002501 [Chlamydomonas incerta]